MCGNIRYQFTGEPAVTALCHCVDCQKVSYFRSGFRDAGYTNYQSISAVADHHNYSSGLAVLSLRTRWCRAPHSQSRKVCASQTNQISIISLVSGTPSSYDVTGASGKINKHFFCSNCGSSLYTELEVMPDMTCVKAGGLDGGAANLGNKIGVEFYVKDRPQYLKPCDGAKQEPQFG
ncbi:hypothetical protein RRF57_002845 [Xylaria bambusicola]|uniref:CENP-V/GFA domain-containing protein n=1 Tax=Xylaria bambusicola TaxID=326684 RepID=A0AAN7U7R1_9PEZI